MLACALLVVCAGAAAAPTESTWRGTLHKEIPALGHRNWVVVADSAYPLQIAPGIETVQTGATQEEVLKAVLQELSSAKHVSPTVFLDAELPFVPEEKAPGVTAYRNQLKVLFGPLKTQSVPHEQLIKTLADAGGTFHVLILKTTLTVPYTSVFFRLDCKYWNEEDEQELRKAMQGSGNK
jgi:hypothetical protein